MKSKLLFIFILLSLIIHVNAETNTPPQSPNQKSREDVNTNNVPRLEIMYLMIDPKVDFWDYMNDTVSKRGSSIAGNKLGPVNKFYLLKMEYKNGYGFIEDWNRMGGDIFGNTFGDSARDVFADMVTTRQLEEDGKNKLTESLLYLVRGSIGNTEEERIDTISVTPQSDSLDKRWWEKTDGNGIKDYGIKLLRKSPYVYATLGIGHVNHKPVILNVRLYSMVMKSDTGIPKLEMNTAVSCSRYSRLVIGGSVYPSHIDSDVYRPSASIRYEHMLSKNSRNKFLSIGTASDGDQFQTVLLLNISM